MSQQALDLNEYHRPLSKRGHLGRICQPKVRDHAVECDIIRTGENGPHSRNRIQEIQSEAFYSEHKLSSNNASPPGALDQAVKHHEITRIPIGPELHATAIGIPVNYTGDISVGETGSDSYIQYLGSGDFHSLSPRCSLIWIPRSHELKRRSAKSQGAEKSGTKSEQGLRESGDRGSAASMSISRVLPRRLQRGLIKIQGVKYGRWDKARRY
ncbi:hypothetical protein BDR22DRAFT_890056 [Usnea florida]